MKPLTPATLFPLAPSEVAQRQAERLAAATAYLLARGIAVAVTGSTFRYVTSGPSVLDRSVK